MKKYQSKFQEINESVPEPMLAVTYDSKQKLPDNFFVQPKLDGIHAIVNCKTGDIYSRNKNKIVLSHITEAIKKANITEVDWMAGELYAHGFRFGEVMSMIRSNRIGDKRKDKIKLYIFDCISPLPFEERMKIVDKIASKPELKGVAEPVTAYAATPDKLKFFHDQFVKFGFEGSMIRTSGTGYETGKRATQLMKHKDFLDAEFEIVGGVKEESSDPNKPEMIGTFTMKSPPGAKKDTFDAQPMATEKEKIEMWKNLDSYIGKMATIKYQELDPKSLAPRFAKFVRVRNKNF